MKEKHPSCPNFPGELLLTLDRARARTTSSTSSRVRLLPPPQKTQHTTQWPACDSDCEIDVPAFPKPPNHPPPPTATHTQSSTFFFVSSQSVVYTIQSERGRAFLLQSSLYAVRHRAVSQRCCLRSLPNAIQNPTLLAPPPDVLFSQHDIKTAALLAPAVPMPTPKR